MVFSSAKYMSAAGHTTNLGAYRVPEIVAHYASLDYLTSAELLLFQTYIVPGAVLMDLGVGGGRTTPYLSSIASTYVGVDYSEEMIRACRIKYPMLRFEVADAADLSAFPTGSFDAIVFSFNGIDNLEPNEKRHQCLRECQRLLKVGGTLIFSSHNPRSLIVGWYWDWDRMRTLAHKSSAHNRLLFGLILAGLSCAKLGIAVFKAGVQSIPRAARRLRTRMFWLGEGYLFDPSHGGLWTHLAKPDRVIAELNKFQFTFLQILPEDHPRTSRGWSTRWYYYAFSKT